MSTDTGSEPRKKHRHDLGQEDHGPTISAGTTRGIQAVLAACIAATLILVLWFFVDATAAARRGKSSPRPPGAATTSPSTSH